MSAKTIWEKWLCFWINRGTFLEPWIICCNELLLRIFRKGFCIRLPYEPAFVNIFTCHHEETWLQECPSVFKPVIYHRYIDDTFLLYRDKLHAEILFDYMISKHSFIKFSTDHESSNSLAFLHVLIRRSNSCFTTTFYRKSTPPRLSISFFQPLLRINQNWSSQNICSVSIRKLSNHIPLQRKFEFIEYMFHNNGF